MSVIITALTSHRWEFAVTNCRLYWYNTAMEIIFCASKYSFFSSYFSLSWMIQRKSWVFSDSLKIRFFCPFLSYLSSYFWVIWNSSLGADHLTLEGEGGWFWKKISSKGLSEEKNCMQQKCNRKLMGKKGKKMSCPPDC